MILQTPWSGVLLAKVRGQREAREVGVVNAIAGQQRPSVDLTATVKDWLID